MNKRILLFWGGSALLILLGATVYIAINGYLSGDQSQAGVKKELSQAYVTAMTADIYGGQTPQETFDLFVAALGANDPDLAAKYFILDDNLSRDKWTKALNILKDKGLLTKMAEETTFSSTNIEFNKYSKVWKIVSI